MVLGLVLVRLTARGFRNLHDLEFEPGEGTHLLLGGTGAGKTSILEAAYVVSTTRSFRSSRLDACLRHTAAGCESEVAEGAPEAFHVAAEVEQSHQRVRLEVGWSAAQGVSRSVNQDSGSLAEHLTVLPVLAFTASDSEVLLGGPEARRRLLDRGVVSCRPAAIGTLSKYRRVLENKRRVLAERQQGLETWNELLAPAMSELIGARAAYVEELVRALERVRSKVSIDWPVIDLRYDPSPREAMDGEAAVLEVLSSLADQERRERRPAVGPHRDRLVISWGGRDVRRVASAGERKGLGLLLVAAQSEALRQVGRSPLQLLDDADAELDRETLKRLWPALSGVPQTVVTSNRPEAWEGLDLSRVSRVVDGQLTVI